MKRFTFPATFTTTGWIEIWAETITEAADKARELNESGIDKDQINDPEDSSEIEVNEGQEIIESL